MCKHVCLCMGLCIIYIHTYMCTHVYLCVYIHIWCVCICPKKKKKKNRERKLWLKVPVYDERGIQMHHKSTIFEVLCLNIKKISSVKESLKRG